MLAADGNTKTKDISSVYFSFPSNLSKEERAGPQRGRPGELFLPASLSVEQPPVLGDLQL